VVAVILGAWAFNTGYYCVLSWTIAIFIGAQAWLYVADTNRLGRKPSSESQENRDVTLKLNDSPELPDWQVSLLIKSIIRPASVFPRIKEKVELMTRAHMVSSTYWLEVDLGLSVEDPLLVPLVMPAKGTLLDGFSIRDQDGREIPTLSFNEGVLLMGRVFEKLMSMRGPDLRDQYTASGLETRLLNTIGHRGPLTPSVERECQAVKADMRKMLGASRLTDLIEVMIDLLVSRYPIIISLDRDSTQGETIRRAVIASSRRLILRRTALGKRQEFLDFFRSIFGVRPNQFVFPIENAARSGSYHLEFFGPEGTYLSSQRYRRGDLVENADYFRFRSRLGQRYSHFYCRQAGSAFSQQVLQFAFHERPPGSIAAATLSAFALTVGVFAASKISMFAVENHPGTLQTQSDAIALLIALPAFAAGWLGVEGRKSVAGGVLGARMSSAAVILLACAAIVVFYQTPPLDVSEKLVVKANQDTWTTLLYASAGVWVLTASAWVRRASAYSFVLGKEVHKRHIGAKTDI